MSKLWLGAGVAVVVAALAACGSSDTTGPGTTGVSGTWTFQELLSAASVGFTCADSATIKLTQSGQTVSGTFAQTGVCSQGGQTFLNDTTGVISNGAVKGDSIAFNEDTCRYTGTITGSPATRMGGSVLCPDSVVDVTGTWVMTR